MNMSFNKQMCRQQSYQTGRDEAMRCLQLHVEVPRLGQPQMQEMTQQAQGHCHWQNDFLKRWTTLDNVSNKTQCIHPLIYAVVTFLRKSGYVSKHTENVWSVYMSNGSSFRLGNGFYTCMNVSWDIKVSHGLWGHSLQKDCPIHCRVFGIPRPDSFSVYSRALPLNIKANTNFENTLREWYRLLGLDQPALLTHVTSQSWAIPEQNWGSVGNTESDWRLNR